MRTGTITAALLLLLSSVATAQTVTGLRINIYQAGASSPTTFFDFAAGATVCNQDPTPAPAEPVVNPSTASWNDPVNAGRECRWTDDGTGPLRAVPLGSTYEATLQFSNSEGRGPESNRAPFTRLAPPTTAPAGFRLRRAG